MAILSKSRARKPLAEGDLQLAASGGAVSNGQPVYNRFKVGCSVRTDNGWTFFDLTLSRAETIRTVSCMLKTLAAREGDPTVWMGGPPDVTPAGIARAIRQTIESGEVRELERIAERLETISSKESVA